MLKRVVTVAQIAVALLTAAFVVALFTGGSDDDGAPDDAAAEASPGALVYADSCASCHGPDGGGGVGPTLAGGLMVERYPEAADQVVVVANGRGGMPRFADRLTPEEIDAVVAFTREDL